MQMPSFVCTLNISAIQIESLLALVINIITKVGGAILVSEAAVCKT